MTFAKTAIVSCQQMVTVFSVKRFAVCQPRNNIFDFIHVITAFGSKLQILYETDLRVLFHISPKMSSIILSTLLYFL